MIGNIDKTNLMKVEALLGERIRQTILVIEDLYPMTAEDLQDAWELYQGLRGTGG